MLNDKEITCQTCLQNYTWDMESKSDNIRHRLPVLSTSRASYCTHHFCYGCILKQQATLAKDQEDAPQWLSCMICKTEGAFCPSQPKFHRFLVDLLGRVHKSRRKDDGRVHSDRGNLHYAKENYYQALVEYKKALNIQMEDAALSHQCISWASCEREDYYQALKHIEDAIRIQDEFLEPDNLNNFRFRYDAGLILFKRGHYGDYDRALTHIENALNLLTNFSGPNHPGTAITRAMCHQSIGEVYHEKEDFDQALIHHERALEIRITALGPEHLETARSHHDIGEAYYKKGDYYQALIYHEQALKIRMKVYGLNHEDTATSHCNMAWVFQQKGDYDQAFTHHEKALKMRMEVLEPGHPDIAESRDDMDWCSSMILKRGLFLDPKDSNTFPCPIEMTSEGYTI